MPVKDRLFTTGGYISIARTAIVRAGLKQRSQVSPAQPRLFPDPQPLVERLGREFFLGLPTRPGVYFLRGPAETVLYVGKAKSLRHRLGSYRVANPERMPRRILRLVHRVESIVWEECADEGAALAREAELLLELRPKFNRAGVWQPPAKHLAWRTAGHGVDLAVQPELVDGWTSLGSVRVRPRALLQALARLAWCRLQPERGLPGLPCGWWRGRAGDLLNVPGDPEEFRQLLADLAEEQNPILLASVFDQRALSDDIELLHGNLP